MKLESWAAGGGAALHFSEHVFTASDSGAIESFDYLVHTDADELVVVVGATGGWGGPTANDGEFSFDNIQVVPEPYDWAYHGGRWFFVWYETEIPLVKYVYKTHLRLTVHHQMSGFFIIIYSHSYIRGA